MSEQSINIFWCHECEAMAWSPAPKCLCPCGRQMTLTGVQVLAPDEEPYEEFWDGMEEASGI